MTVTKHVDLKVYQENLKLISNLNHPSRVMAVIKADGYGHGLIETAKAAAEAGVSMLGVLDIETGLILRKAEISTPSFAWLHSPQSNFAAAISQGIELSAGSLAELNRIAFATGRAQVHLKIDTGLSRNGCRPEDWHVFVTRARELEIAGEIDLVAIWSHLSGTSKVEDAKAIETFEKASEIATRLGFSGYRHIASSPAALNLPESRYDLVRIGVSAFGTSPSEENSAEKLGLQMPMRLTAKVVGQGEISIGFLHGFFSQFSGKVSVIISGKKYLVESVGPLTSSIETGNYSAGEEVVIFGSGRGGEATAEELCNTVGTVTDELFTGIKANLVSYAP